MSGSEGEVPSRDIDEDEIPDSQVQDAEPQSSCETLLSQLSANEDLSERQEDKIVEVSDNKSLEISIVNSSLEGNTSGGNIASSFSEKTLPLGDLGDTSAEEKPPIVEEEVCKGETEGDLFEEKEDQGDGSFKKEESRKRKGMSDDATPSPKRLCKEIQPVDVAEKNDSTEPVYEEHSKSHDVSVMEISSTPEKTIVIDDSQEFSLRIEESSPPGVTRSGGEKSDSSQKDSQGLSTGKTSWESHKGGVQSLCASPATSAPSASLSQKSVASWSSHTHDGNLSWGSHKGVDDIKTMKEENGEHAIHYNGSEKESSPDSLNTKNADNAHVRGGMEVRTGLVAVFFCVMDNNNKVVSAQLKQLSLPEDYPVEKDGRLSMVSTTSAKSSSSAGSVGLPGPFPLPGRSRARMSTVSTISSSSSSSSKAWDGPFLKPQVPGSKLKVTFCCEKCGHHNIIPPVDHSTSTSPIVNSSPPVSEEEEKSEEKSLTPKKVRKQQGNYSGSTVSSGPLEEETSSSVSQNPPQASSTPTRLPRGRPKRQQNGTALRASQKSSRGEEGSSPLSRTPRSAGRISRNGTLQSSAKKVEKGEGEPVLARWGGDGRYYPGWVAEPLTASQVLVCFCDGQSKPTSMTKVVKADIITPGTLVLAATRSGDYEEALVVQVDSNGSEPVYRVERDKNQRVVQFPNIALQQSTVTELTVSEAQRVAATSNFNDLSLENIIAHPRKRSARTPMEAGHGRKKKRQTTPQPCTSHGQTYNGPEENYGDTDSSTHSSCSLDLRGKEIKPLDVECFPPESLSVKLVYNRCNMAYKKKEAKMIINADEEIDKRVGPIPEPGSKLFTDCVFLITYTDVVKLMMKEYAAYSGIEDSSESTRAHHNLWRDRLRKQIINGGGKICNSFSEVTKEELPNTYLITDKQCNTPLYLQCVVHNIPIYSNSVVIQCCAQNRPWKEVISGRGVKRMLAGYSLSRGCLVNPRSLTPLRGRTLLLALSGDPSLSNFWQTLVTKVGGSVDIHPHGSFEETKYDIVVTDTDCDRELVAEACEKRVPLVSMTWLQQVIITGEWRPPTEHPLYKYNTSGEGESPEY